MSISIFAASRPKGLPGPEEALPTFQASLVQTMVLPAPLIGHVLHNPP